LARKEGAVQEREKEDRLRYRADVGRVGAIHESPVHEPPLRPSIGSVGANVRGLLEKLREKNHDG
jgi:hypothetical protein